MKKIRNIIALWLCVFALSALLIPFLNHVNTASAKTVSSYFEDEGDYAIEPRGLAVNMSLTIDGANGQISATAKNSFTLFPSTVQVYVYLYSSETNCESYVQMNLEKSAYIGDLDMGKTISVSASTGGKQKYWQARMRYKLDNKNWVEKSTPTFLFDADGKAL